MGELAKPKSNTEILSKVRSALDKSDGAKCSLFPAATVNSTVYVPVELIVKTVSSTWSTPTTTYSSPEATLASRLKL